MPKKQTNHNRPEPGGSRLIPFLALCLLIACGQTPIKPVELQPEDMCSFCKMAISEKRYAAEIMTIDGDAFKFDDIGCMVDYVKSHIDKKSIAAFFVVDFESNQWLKAEESIFLLSPEVKTPMSGGAIAFKERARAEAAAEKRKGRLLSFAEVMSDAR